MSLSAPKAKEDPLVQMQAEIGAEEWERYKQDFAPKEAEFIEGVTGIGSDQERQFLEDFSETERQQQTGPLQATSRLSPLLNKATSKSQLPEKNLLQSKQRKAKGLETAISLGRNIGAGALGRIGRQAQIGTGKNIALAEAKGIQQQGIYNAVGTAAGVGLYKGLNKKGAPNDVQ